MDYARRLPQAVNDRGNSANLHNISDDSREAMPRALVDAHRKSVDPGQPP